MTQELWQQQAQKLGGEALVEVIENMADDIHEIRKSMEDLVKTAFPNGDVIGHSSYHKAMIDRNEELRRLRRAVEEKTLSGLIWAFLVFLGLCVFNYVIGLKPPHFPP